MDMVKIGIIGVSAVLLGMFLKNYKGEYGVLIGMAAGICIFVFLIGKLESILAYVESIEELLPIDERYIGMILKMIGITYIAEFSTDICKDAGYQAIAGQIEMFAKLSILLISMPVMMGFIETVGEFL